MADEIARVFDRRECGNCPQIIRLQGLIEMIKSQNARTDTLVDELSKDIKAINGKFDNLNAELAKLRESVARHIGLWTGGAIVVSALISKFVK